MKVLLINPRKMFRSGNIWKSVLGFMPPLGLAQTRGVPKNKTDQRKDNRR